MRARLVAVLLVFLSGQIFAQTVTVRLIDGGSGKPIGSENVTIFWGTDLFTKIIVPIDKKGVGRFQVLAGNTSFSMMSGPKVGKEPNRIAYLDCNEGDASNVSIKEVMQKGFVPRNDCSKKVFVSRKPGEVVYFAKLRPWWMPDMQ